MLDTASRFGRDEPFLFGIYYQLNLRNRTQADLTPKLLEDETLFYRFCKARDFKLEDAEAMLRKHIVWREENQIDTILTDYKPLEACKYAPTSFLCFDKEGCVVRYMDVGNTDTKGLFNAVKKEDLLKYCLHGTEYDIDLLSQQCKKLGKTVYQYSQVCNFENMTFGQATNKKMLETSIMFLKTFQDNYPERIKYVFHINASVYYTTTMSVMKVFMATPLMQKIQAFGSEGWKEALLEQIHAEELPAFLGGKLTDPDGDPLCKSFVVHGQKVPKEFFFTNYEKKLSKAPDAKKVTVTRFSKEEVRLDVRLPGSFLEWEFETKSKDIGFGVFFKTEDDRPVELVPKQRIDTCYGPEKGLFKCLKAGTYTVVFDNSFSWMHPREIYYRIRIRNPDEVED
ncbi:unnamed protein product [Larinioides sclopetarius]|uniref:SEC14-like protein 2 n=1 Tax=Larinioides sclopetarius TaxID=280406 RepID=A0AAV2AS38_9ARAC